MEDIANGAGATGICAGFIGEIGCTWPLTDFERKSLRVSAKAQKSTGAALNIHPGQRDTRNRSSYPRT